MIWAVGKEILLWGFQILPKKIKTWTRYFLKSRCNFDTKNPTLATITHMHLTNEVLMKAMDCGVVKKNGQYLKSIMQTMTWSLGLNLWLGGWIFQFASYTLRKIVQLFALTFGESKWHTYSFAMWPKMCYVSHNMICTPSKDNTHSWIWHISSYPKHKHSGF